MQCPQSACLLSPWSACFDPFSASKKYATSQRIIFNILKFNFLSRETTNLANCYLEGKLKLLWMKLTKLLTKILTLEKDISKLMNHTSLQNVLEHY